MSDRFEAEHRNAAPAVPDAAALNRVSGYARRRVQPAAGRGRWPMVVRIAAGVAVAALAVGVFAATLSPRVDDSAFARQAAVRALLPRGEILYTKGTWISHGVNSQYPKPNDSRMSWESWIDVERQLSRSEMRAEDGSIAELGVQSGKLVRMLGRDGKLDEKTGQSVPLGYRVVQYEAPVPMDSPGGPLVDALRDGLASGEARVTDKQTIDGDEYWVVYMKKNPEGSDYPVTLRATMRVGDYALKDVEMVTEGGDGKGATWSDTLRIEFSEWKTVSRDSLAKDFFAIDSADKAAPADAVIDVPLGQSSP